MASANPFSSRISRETNLEKGTAILMEFDPSSSYEVAVNDFAREHLAAGAEVVAFTSKASPISTLLEATGEVKMFLMGERVAAGASPTERRETLVVHNDPDLILNALGQSLKTGAPRPKCVIFDNLSNMVLLLGIEKTYKFAKRANELLFEAGASSLFLLVSGAHEDGTRNAIESIFRRIILYGREGMTVRK